MDLRELEYVPEKHAIVHRGSGVVYICFFGVFEKIGFSYFIRDPQILIDNTNYCRKNYNPSEKLEIKFNDKVVVDGVFYEYSPLKIF
jgi:hypothetical protein